MAQAGQGTAKRSPKTIAGKMRPAVDPAHQKSLNDYQNALKFMQEGKFEKARELFVALAEHAAPELQERSRVYLAVCARNAKQEARSFSTPEEHYDYGISLLNTGFYDEAREQFEAILKAHPAADYALYGLAVLESMTGQAEGCLEHLGHAIQINSRNRIQARTDSDFQDMADDPRFTELLYPEMA
jgi:tetratricopeptide (TPR) repeat protein